MTRWNQLIAAREQKHLSQVEAAERANVSVVTYQRWETGRASPQPHHRRQLSELFGDLFESDEPSCLPLLPALPLSEDHAEHTSVDELETFIAAHLTVHLWSLAFKDASGCHEKRRSIRQAIEEFDFMNTNNKNYQMTRREALCSLATLPIITLGSPAAGSSVPKTQYKSALEQCAASVEACWILRESDNPADRGMVLQCTTRYLSLLQTIAQHSSQHRQEALELAAGYALIRSNAARHNLGLAQATQYGKEALALSKEAGDISLQLGAYAGLAWTYFCAKKSPLALATATEAEALLLHYISLPHAQPINLYAQGTTYSSLAVLQARNGLSPEDALGKAIETQPGDKGMTFVSFNRGVLLCEAGWAYCYGGDQKQAMAWLEQAIDPETLAPKVTLCTNDRVELLNIMAFSSLRGGERDLERAMHFWKAGIEGAKALQSEQRFSEALANYDLMEAIWSGEPRVASLRDHLVHWE